MPDGTYNTRGEFKLSSDRADINLYDLPVGSGSGGGGTSVALGYVYLRYFNYIYVTPGPSYAGIAYAVAKPPNLWCISSRTEHGQARTYAYPSVSDGGNYGQARVASVSGNPDELELVDPQYLVGDQVLYIPMNLGQVTTADDYNQATGTPITNQELGNNRNWSSWYDQSYTP
jgi:hypothetical protein